MTHRGDQGIGVVSGRLPDNPGELACIGVANGKIRDSPRR